MLAALAVAFFHGPGETNRADRFLWRAAARTGNTRNRERDLRVGMGKRALGHGARGLLTHRAVARENGGLHTQHFALGQIGVGNKTAFEPLGAARHGRDHLRYPAAGAGFGRDQHQALTFQLLADGARECFEFHARKDNAVSIAATEWPKYLSKHLKRRYAPEAISKTSRAAVSRVRTERRNRSGHDSP